jgi:hypothetical protein
MAIKPVPKELVDKVPELINLGLLKAGMAHSGQAVENAMKEFDNLISNPFYRDAVQRSREAEYANNIIGESVSRPVVDPESLLGKAVVNYMTDRSKLGQINSYMGTPTNVVSQAGADFTPKHDPLGLGWLSMGKFDEGKLGTAQKAHRNAQLLAEATGNDVLANSIMMAEKSSRFSTPPSELMLSRIQDMNMPKGLLDQFDEEIRKVNPDWVGVRSDSAMDQLMGRNGFSMEGAGAERKRFLEVLDKPEFRKAGFPQPDTTLPLIDNPDYANAPYGMSGLNMWMPDTGKGTSLQLGLHNSYSHGMPSKGMVGEFETPISWQAMNPRPARELGLEMTKPKKGTPKPLTPMQMVNANATRLAGNRGTIQITDQEWLDSVSKAIQHNKGLVAKYGSIPAALAAGEVLADDGMRNDPIGDLRASEAQFGMSPQERAIADLRASEAGFVPASDPQWKPAKLPWLADTLGQIKGNKNYQNAEIINPVVSLVDTAYNTAMGAENTLGDYIFSGLEASPVTHGASKGAMTLWDLIKGLAK